MYYNLQIKFCNLTKKKSIYEDKIHCNFTGKTANSGVFGLL